LKNITIYSVASCDTVTRVGYYNASLEYKGKFKYHSKKVEDTTTNRCIIIGIIDSFKMLKEPCTVKVVTSTLLGINKWKKNKKGINADLITELHQIAVEEGCILSFEVLENEGKRMRELATE